MPSSLPLSYTSNSAPAPVAYAIVDRYTRAIARGVFLTSALADRELAGLPKSTAVDLEVLPLFVAHPLVVAVMAERAAQVAQWGSGEHDDKHSDAFFADLVVRFAHKAASKDTDPDATLHRFIQAAALCVAAAESVVRKQAAARNADALDEDRFRLCGKDYVAKDAVAGCASCAFEFISCRSEDDAIPPCQGKYRRDRRDTIFTVV